MISIDRERLFRLIADFSRIGGLPGGGVNRPALSQHDLAGRAFLKDYAEAHDLPVWTDAAANLHFSLAGKDACIAGAVVMTGSHIDSVPRGGNLDGAFGVLAGIETLLSARDEGAQTEAAIEVVAFTDEEGRFGGMIGSEALTGRLPAEAADQLDDDGFTLRDALQAIGLDAGRMQEAARDLSLINAFVELHIEQGPVLDQAGTPIGVVTGIAGLYKLRCRFTGVAAHAGTNPMHLRRDALAGLCELHLRIPQIVRGDAVATVGHVELTPNAANVIPGEVVFSLDLRATDAKALDVLRSTVLDGAEVIARTRGLAFAQEQISYLPPVPCSPRVMETVESVADAIGYAKMRLPSGAAHDTMSFSALNEIGMVFVPSIGGISHNTAEQTTDEDLLAGANVLANTLLELAR